MLRSFWWISERQNTSRTNAYQKLSQLNPHSGIDIPPSFSRWLGSHAGVKRYSTTCPIHMHLSEFPLQYKRFKT